MNYLKFLSTAALAFFFFYGIGIAVNFLANFFLAVTKV